MKKLITMAFIIGFYLTSYSQIDFNNPPWETGCDSLTTQTEMNICSNEKYQIADSILNLYYDKLINYLELQIQTESKRVIETSDLNDYEYLQDLKKQKDAIIQSRKNFKIFLNSTTEIIDIQYKGGSIRPLAVNTYALNLTVNQIKIMIELMDEIMSH